MIDRMGQGGAACLRRGRGRRGLRYLPILGLAVALAGCDLAPTNPTPPPRQSLPGTAQTLSAREIVDQFVDVRRTMEPLIEDMCAARTRGVNCDFRIAVDDNVNAAPNAYQTEQADGRPLIVFTLSLLADVRSGDELAFILGHEAGHHIAGHLAQTRDRAVAGGLLGGVIAAYGGASQTGIEAAQRLGAGIGARQYSKSFELEADELGAIMATQAGYDAIKGAQFFARIPDPGDRFLGSHPPNAARMNRVAQTVARMRAGGV